MTTAPPYSLQYYLDLITSQWRTAPNFNAWLSANLQLYQDVLACLSTFPGALALNPILSFTELADCIGDVISLIPPNANVRVGQIVTGLNIPPNTIVVSLSGNSFITNVTVSQNVTTNGFYTISFFNGAIGPQLDLLGSIIGQSRTVGFQPSNSLVLAAQTSAIQFVSNIITVGSATGIAQGQVVIGTPSSAVPSNTTVTSITGLQVTLSNSPTTSSTFMASFYNSIAVSPVLDDATYRLLLQARVAQNHWNGQIDTLIRLWNNLFPGGFLIVDDNQDMTVNLFVAASLTTIIQNLISNGYVIPRPQGVEYIISFADLPIFGFDRNDQFIAAFDLAYFS